MYKRQTRADLVPVVSADLALSIVVDASAAGAASLPSWLSAGARFSLAAPPRTRAVVIADRAPAAVVAGPVRGPTGVVRALDTIRASGARDTAAALALAGRQFPGTEAGRRVTLLYTSAEGVDGLTAAQLAGRFRAAGIVLVVVGASDPGRYWSSATTATGGFFAPAGSPVVVSALDQVEATLSGRYLVRFATPAKLPARASVSIRAGDVVLAAETALGPPAPEPDPRAPMYWLVGGSTAVILLVMLLLRLRRPVPPRVRAVPRESPPPLQSLSMRPPPHGRAAVPFDQ